MNFFGWHPEKMDFKRQIPAVRNVRLDETTRTEFLVELSGADSALVGSEWLPM
jgi:hypothetical protein